IRFCVFFFFQAEDGIRDFHVTGVQTCALPISLEKSENEQIRKFAQLMIDDHTKALEELRALAQSKGITLPDDTDLQHKTLKTAQIGRASCRERVEIAVGADAGEEYRERRVRGR